jgi:hypothetical protein
LALRGTRPPERERRGREPGLSLAVAASADAAGNFLMQVAVGVSNDVRHLLPTTICGVVVILAWLTRSPAQQRVETVPPLAHPPP